MSRYVLLLMLAAACLAGCSGLPLSPVTNDRRPVQFVQDPSKTLTLMHDMTLDDGSPVQHELRLPAGRYALEAQDDEYWYMRSGAAIEFKEIHKGGRVENRDFTGGIMIGKYLFRSVPAGGYIDGDGSTRILMWKLGGEFIGREGKDWKKSF